MKKALITLLTLIITSVIIGQTENSEIDPDKLDQLIAFCDTVTMATEVLVIHNDAVIAWYKDETCDSIYMNTSSMAKSWTGLVVGILIDKKIIESVDDLVTKYIPEWKAGAENMITIKHLLTMTAGIDRRRGVQGILAEKDMRTYLLNFTPDTLPGIRFGYSNESVQLLGMVIESATGRTANEAFYKYFFEPLGMDSTGLVRDAAGNDIVYGGTRTTMQDAALVGRLMLHKGNHNGKQLVSQEWIEASLTPGELAPYYGYLWWLDNNSQHRNYAATGDGGQLTIVFPDLNLIFLRRQQCHHEKTGNMPWMGPGFLKMITDIVIQ